MSNCDYVYEIVIGAAPERVWEALTSAEFTQQYWNQTRVRSDFEPGGRIEFLVGENDDVGCEGEILTVEAPRQLAYTWRFPRNPETRDEAPSRVTFLLEPVGAGAATRLRIVHDQFPEGSRMPGLVGPGWPLVFAGLKTLLETGNALDFSMME